MRKAPGYGLENRFDRENNCSKSNSLNEHSLYLELAIFDSRVNTTSKAPRMETSVASFRSSMTFFACIKGESRACTGRSKC